MCGIAGFVGKMRVVDAELMLEKIDSRGGHAYGYASIDKGVYHIFKDNTPVPKGVRLPESEQMIMHTRFATNGSPDVLKNNHPFESKEWLLVHNGVVQNRTNTQKTECDSESILKMLVGTSQKNKEFDRVKSVVERIDGSFRLGIINKKSRNLYVVSDASDPVYIEVTKSYVAFASEEWQLPQHGIRMRATDCSIYQITPLRKMKQLGFKKHITKFNRSWRDFSFEDEEDVEYTHEMRVNDTLNELNHYSYKEDKVFAIEECCEECEDKDCGNCPLCEIYCELDNER